ncbi:MAG: zinc-dependent alcohol dehydrogenase family protein [Burkholderiaceae bacterium]|nr:zinc-dependent alcohol dehydrogenase family protein [Burkholderiaceae bacterium]
MSVMRAVVVRSPGGLDALELAELPLPVPGPGQARVKAVAIGVGRPDALIRTGRYKWMPPLPAIPGNEMAGVVDALGPDAQGVALGDRVLLSSRELPQRGGGYAQYALAPAAALYALPDAISFDDAVGLPNYQLAHALLFGCGAALPAQSVLLTGAAGGVASAMVQLARARRLQVIATASTPAKRGFVRDNGAHEVLDPAATDLTGQVMAATAGKGVDLVVDPIGGALFIACLRALAPLGMAVSYNIVSGMPQADVFSELRALLGRSLAVRVFSMHTFDADPVRRRVLMQSAIDAIASGQVRAPQATVLPLADARRAHALLDAPDTVGKIILHP